MGCVEERASAWVDLSLRRATGVRFVNPRVLGGSKFHPKAAPPGSVGSQGPGWAQDRCPRRGCLASGRRGRPGWVAAAGGRVAGGARAARGGACSGRCCPRAPGRGGRRRGQLERAGAEKVEPPRPPPGL